MTGIWLLLLLFPLTIQSAAVSTNIDGTGSSESTSDCMYSWLRELGFKPAQATEYTQLFANEAVDERILAMTSPEALLDMGITKLGHRTLILHSSQSMAYPMCLNAGSCELNSDDSSFSCSCLEGFAGGRCQNVIGCGETVCRNGGLCSMEEGEVDCSCPLGYSGTCCEHDICDELPCLNGGTCTRSAAGHSCSCPLGYEGENCESMWLNKTSFDQLTKQVLFLEALYEFTENKVDQKINQVHQLAVSALGPKLYIHQATYGPEGTVQSDHFTFGEKQFRTFLVDSQQGPQLSGLFIYEVGPNSTLKLSQHIPILGPISHSLSSQAGDSHVDVFVAVISAPTQGSVGPNKLATIYKYTQNTGFSFTQELRIDSATDAVFVTAENVYGESVYDFLVFSCTTDGEGNKQDSLIYLWLRNSFTYYQSLPSQGHTVHSILTPDARYLTLSGSESSTIYHWNVSITYFQLYKSLPASKDLYPLASGDMLFLVLVNDVSTLYSLKSHESGLLTQQATVSTKGAVLGTHVHIDPELYVVFASDSSAYVCLLTGPGLALFQTLPHGGSLYVDETSLALSNGYTEIYTWKTT